VCDLQGRYRRESRGRKSRCRFELTDPAICSRQRSYGPTDMGEKGIETFFSKHACNEFCNQNGRWQRPRSPKEWFPCTDSTSMLPSSFSYHLTLQSTMSFRPGFDTIAESDDSDDSDYYDDSYY
jgi:hypothetical protein